jgi:hypothetical protein
MENWKPVIFGTLTQPNASLLQLARGDAGWIHIDALETFMARACLRWRVHLRFDVGWEDTRNQHSHLITSVLEDEFETWLLNRDRFDPRLAWRWKRSPMKWDDFDEDHPGDVDSYVKVKHTHLLEIKCPKRRAHCRKGRCILTSRQ